MKDEPSAEDDPLVQLQLHESTARLLSALLRALEELTQPGDKRVSPEVRSFLMQALDNAADLDILFGVLADDFEEALRRGTTNHDG